MAAPVPLQIRVSDGESEHVLELGSTTLLIGRGAGCDLALKHPSVSRHHAELERVGERWCIRDLESTNGVRVNGLNVREQVVVLGDSIQIGEFDLILEAVPAPAAPEPLDIPNATLVRPVAAHRTDQLFVREQGQPRNIEVLHGLAGQLLRADTTDELLVRVMDAAFRALPVDRGVIVLGDAESPRCELLREGREVTMRPPGGVPVSTTILEAVLRQKVGLLTLDAQGDARLAGGESIVLHGIRSAMCAPLWSEDGITGFVQVDSPFREEAFDEADLDFFMALANFAAIAVERARERTMRGRLERYHSPAIVEDVLRAADGQSRPLKESDVTVLFGDLVGFTSFASEAPLERVAELLRGFCTLTSDAIFEAEGTLDKFIGDGVMAFFGAPVEQADHARRAVRAALTILRSVREWNEDRVSKGLPAIACRVGLNSGPVLVGDVGSEQRVDYTVLGNTVNVASRVEQMAPPGTVAISEATRQALAGSFETSELGAHDLKGLGGAVRLYRVLEPADQGTGHCS